MKKKPESHFDHSLEHFPQFRQPIGAVLGLLLGPNAELVRSNAQQRFRPQLVQVLLQEAEEMSQVTDEP